MAEDSNTKEGPELPIRWMHSETSAVPVLQFKNVDGEWVDVPTVTSGTHSSD